MIEVTSEIIQYFGKSHIPPLWLVPQVIEQDDHLGDLVRRLQNQLEEEHLSYDGEEPTWASQLIGFDETDQRLYRTVHVISDAIAAERMKLLLEKGAIVKPYDTPDLDGITPDSEGLVYFDDFVHDIRFFPGLNRNNTIFEALLPLPKASNSMYWTLDELRKLVDKKIKLRLDPLLVHDVNEYSPMSYKMMVWGKPLDWNAIASLRQVEHLRWIPDPGWQEDVQFTDLVWIPRDDGVHFVCEEVPKLGALRFRGSRYFHAIFQPYSDAFVHCDGALRLYSREELLERHQAHVRNIGKIGKRIKSFLVQDEITTEEWTNLVCTYFVWNNDLQYYFGVGINRIKS